MTIGRNALIRIALCGLLAASSACAFKRLSEADRQRVGAVAIDPNVNVPQNLFVEDRTSNLLGMLGFIGILVDAARADPADRILAFEREKGISIGEILHDEFEKQLRERGIFQVATPGDATLSLEVESYGMSVRPGFASEVVPLLMVKAQLSDAEQRMLWKQKRGTYRALNPVPARQMSVLETDEGVLREFWRSAAEAVVGELLDSLQSKS